MIMSSHHWYLQCTRVSREGGNLHLSGTVSSFLPLFQPHTPSCLSFNHLMLSHVPVVQDRFVPVHDELPQLCLPSQFTSWLCLCFLKSFSVALTKKGLKRVMDTKSRQKHPITVNLLRRMRTVLDLSIPMQATLWCLFLVDFFSFLRKSNLTTPSAHAFNPSEHLTRNDIKFSGNGAVLWIHWSKTLQHREGIPLIPPPLI